MGSAGCVVHVNGLSMCMESGGTCNLIATTADVAIYGLSYMQNTAE